MDFEFDFRASDSPLVETVWHTTSGQAGTFISRAATNWEMVITNYRGETSMVVRGPENAASVAPVPEDAEFFGIAFKLGTFMPHLPLNKLVNSGLMLPQAGGQSTFWLQGASWQMPTFDNADSFVQRLVRDGVLVREPLVDAVLHHHIRDLSVRSVQRRFLRATGLTHGEVAQIRRANEALTLLRSGTPILDVVAQAGYADQPHLTRSLRRFIGETPAQILGGAARTG